MKLTTLSVAVAATTLMLAQSAQARGHHRHHLRHQAASGHHFVHREARRHHIFHSEARRHYLVRDREAAMQAGRFEPAWNSEGPDRDYAYAPHRAYRGRNAEREDGWLYPQQARGSGRYARRRVAWENGQEGSYGGGYGRRPSAWCGWEMRHLVSSDPGRRTTLRATGRTGVTAGRRESAPSWSGRTMSARSWDARRANGSSSPETMATGCAPARARSAAPLRSAGADRTTLSSGCRQRPPGQPGGRFFDNLGGEGARPRRRAYMGVVIFGFVDQGISHERQPSTPPRRFHAAGEHSHRRVALSGRLAGHEFQLRAHQAVPSRRWSGRSSTRFSWPTTWPCSTCRWMRSSAATPRPRSSRSRCCRRCRR